jgi:beta-lactamase superfamily II metal-dependent hydrolase
MRKLVILVVLLFSILLAISCEPTQEPPKPSTAVPPTTTTPQPSSYTHDPEPSPQPAPTPVIQLGELNVHFIDIGQGDSILIDLSDIEVLIDGGEKTPGMVNYIKNYVDGPLEVMVATHTDADHIGGLIDVLAKYQVKGIWLNGDTATSATYSQFMSSVNSEEATIHQAELGNTIEVGNLKFNVLNPSKPLFSDANNNSVVLSLKYGDIDFLFMGDAEREAEAKMLVTCPPKTIPDIIS